MNINESKFRQIIREEARKVLREQDNDVVPPAAPATTSREWDIVNSALGALITALGKDDDLTGAQKIIIGAKLGWAKCKEKSSEKLKAAVDAMAALDTGNPPSKLAAALVSLSGDTPMASNVGGASANLSAGLTATVQKSLADALALAAPVIVDNIVKHSSPAVVTGTPAAVTASRDLTYTVKSGDSISKILRDYYGIPASQSSMPIYRAFAAERLGSDDPSKITVGTAIRLPSSLSLLGKNYARKR